MSLAAAWQPRGPLKKDQLGFAGLLDSLIRTGRGVTNSHAYEPRWLENTHNLSGGPVMPTAWQDAIARHCDEAGKPLHLDGSRLWNAAVAQEGELAAVARGADTIALSLNKSVGAPMGAVLAGPKSFIEQALPMRSALSGEWRPIGPMAAGAAAAIEGWRERLRQDHDTTRLFAARLKARLGDDAVSDPTTNLMLLFCPKGGAGDLSAYAALQGVMVLPISGSMIRFAIHNGVQQSALPGVVDVIARAWDHVL